MQTFMRDLPAPKPRKLLADIRDAIYLKHFDTLVLIHRPKAVCCHLD